MIKNFISLLLVFLIFECRIRSIIAGQAQSTDGTSHEAKGSVVLEADGDEDSGSGEDTEDEDENENRKEGSSIFLSNSVKIPDEFPLDFLEPAEDDAIMNAAREEMCEIGEAGFAENAKEQLRNKLREDKKLTTPWRNEAWLIRFLRAKRYNVDETYKLIQKYYAFKSGYYDTYFKNLVPSEYVQFFKMNFLVPLPGRDKKGRRILLFRASKWDIKWASLDQVFLVAVLLAEAASYEPKTQIAGVQVLVDWEGFNQTSQFIWRWKTTHAISKWLQSGSPNKIKGLHIVNPTDSFVKIQKLFDKFSTPIIKERVHVHKKGTDLNVLYEEYDFDGSNLPKEYKGTLLIELAEKIEWEKILKHCDREFQEILSYGQNKK